jgi:excisionase family DNA binding protein
MKLLTATEAARALGISKQRICYLLAAGRLPATRFGQAWMIRERDLAAFVRLPRGRPAKEKRA